MSWNRLSSGRNNVFYWPSHKVHYSTLDYRRHRANWYFLASGRNSVFIWPCRGSASPAPAQTASEYIYFARHRKRR